MLVHIAKKEALEHLKSFRFLVAFIFIIATFSIMMFARHFEYKSKYDDYLRRIASQEESIEKYSTLDNSSAFFTQILPPSPMEIIVDPALTAVMRPEGIRSIMVQSGRSLDDNPIESINIKLDIIALVGILGSLLALLLSYDSINREVNDGTIKLLLSSGVPRIKIILGKILGGSLAAILPIAAIFLLTSIWMAITMGQDFGLSQWVSLLGIFLVSVIYIMLFYCLGAFVSSVILDQTLSTLSCFGLWILLVIIVPVLGLYISRSIVKVPDLGNIRRQNLAIAIEEARRIGELRRAFQAQGLSAGEALEKARAENKEHSEATEARLNAMQEGFRNASAQQMRLSIRLACISPYSIYLAAVEELSGTGYDFGHLQNVVNNWLEIAMNYLDHQKNEAKKRNPEFTSLDRLDLSNMPRFKYTEPTIGYKYSHALPYILLLSAYFLLPPFLFVYALYSKRRVF